MIEVKIKNKKGVVVINRVPYFVHRNEHIRIHHSNQSYLAIQHKKFRYNEDIVEGTELFRGNNFSSSVVMTKNLEEKK